MGEFIHGDNICNDGHVATHGTGYSNKPEIQWKAPADNHGDLFIK